MSEALFVHQWIETKNILCRFNLWNETNMIPRQTDREEPESKREDRSKDKAAGNQI